jgi:hypothetical protein
MKLGEAQLGAIQARVISSILSLLLLEWLNVTTKYYLTEPNEFVLSDLFGE